MFGEGIFSCLPSEVLLLAEIRALIFLSSVFVASDVILVDAENSADVLEESLFNENKTINCTRIIQFCTGIMITL